MGLGPDALHTGGRGWMSGRRAGCPTPVSAQRSGPRPMYPFTPHLPLRGSRLYILLHLLLVRVSIGLAHICVRALLIHWDTSPRSSRPYRRRSPKRIQDPSLGKNIKASSRRRTVPLYPLPLLTLDLVYLFVFGDLALV